MHVQKDFDHRQKTEAHDHELRRLIDDYLTGKIEKNMTQTALQSLLGLDDLNFTYFLALIERKISDTLKEKLHLYEKKSSSSVTAYPLTLAPASLRARFTVQDFVDLKQKNYARHAKDVTLWQKKMNAGAGSSLKRRRYLKSKTAAGTEIKIGAKATDLFVEWGEPGSPNAKSLSIAEIQILQALHDSRHFGGYFISDLVGPATANHFEELWNKAADGITYRDLIAQTLKLKYQGRVFQSVVPTLDAQENFTFAHTAPAGHALFAVDALMKALFPKTLPAHVTPNLVASISNGEDPNGSPDPAIVGWMAHHKIPIVLVTTEKTPLDKKGGLLCLVENKDTEEIYLKVLETAEAKAAGQLELYESLGGYASTNLTLFNYAVLIEKFRGVTENELMKAITPDLILNEKTIGTSNPSPIFTQLEGAMGSTIMNLDRYWRKKYNEPLVHVVNVDRQHRTEMFSPIKSAFDYFMQFHSDRFSFDVHSMRLKDHRPGHLLTVTLRDECSGDTFYQDVQNVLEAFEGSSILDLDTLSIQGQVVLKNAILEGHVQITNDSGEAFNFSEYFNQQRAQALNPGAPKPHSRNPEVIGPEVIGPEVYSTDAYNKMVFENREGRPVIRNIYILIDRNGAVVTREWNGS